MNKQLLSTVTLCILFIGNNLLAQTFGCDGQSVNAGTYAPLCENPNGGTVTLTASVSDNVVGWLWEDENGEIVRDNLVVENYYIPETTTFTFSGIVISDNQIPDGEFGEGDDFANGFPANYGGTFFTEYVRGPIGDIPVDDDGNPIIDRDNPGYLPPLDEDGTYVITDNAFNGGPGYAQCLDPDGVGNIAVYNLGAARQKVICFKADIVTGREYSFSVQVATVGEVTFDNSDDPAAGPPDGESITNDPFGDVDGDGIPNGLDCCPFLPTASETDCNPCTINGGTEPDSDGDGFADFEDNCPYIANPEQDPAVCSTRDTDQDGILDWADNCPEAFNPGQEDRNGDGIGDACEEGVTEEEGYCIPALDLEMTSFGNQTTLLGETFQSDLEFCVWLDMVRTFTADVTGEVELCLMSACPESAGNFLAIDNLQFSETCRIEDQVTVFVDDISAEILPVEPLDCNTEGVLLEGQWDAIYEDINSIEFFWFEAEQSVLIPGATGEAYFVNEPGTYNFSVLNSETGCFAVFPLEVIDNFSTPEATIEFPDTLSCKNQSVFLDATASAGGSDDGSYIYEWNGVFGAEFINGLPEDNSPIQEVVGSGTYELTITNSFNGCSSETIVFVAENLQSVSLSSVQDNFELGCDTKSAEFQATVDLDPDTNPNDVEYLWISDTDTLSSSNVYEPLVVNESGTYQLFVINNSSGCSDSLTYTVTGEVSGPEIVVQSPTEPISCNTTEVGISASLIDGTNVSYAWTNENGDNLSPNGELDLMVSEPGIYTFTATDNISGCGVEEFVEVFGDLGEPAFSFAIPSPFDCTIDEISLEGILSDPTGNYLFQWFDGANSPLGTELTQAVTEAGSYTLQVEDLDNGCTRDLQINVFDNSAEPQFELVQDQDLNCTNQTANIQINTTEDNLTYAWETIDGTISNDQGSSITLNNAGTYSVTVTDQDNGCTNVASLNVQSDDTLPSVQASQPNNIDCINATSSLFIDDFGAGYTYSWTTQNGNIVSGANSNNPNFDLAGDYTVTISNPNTGCSIDQSYTIVGNSLEPEISISGGGQLGCSDQNLPINVSVNNSIPNVSYTWSSDNGGAFDSQTNIPNALASAAGTYNVIVTNTDNGCTAIESITVTQDNDRPEINLPQPPNLDCNNNVVTLDATGSDNTVGLQITWTAQNGSVISNPNILNPEINQADTYTLTIFNPNNGCETSASVTIDENFVDPTVDLGFASELNCDNPVLTLGGTQTSTGSEFQYQWRDENGNPIVGATSPTLDINNAGIYSLYVLNTATGCENEAQITVIGNADLPEVDAGQSVELDCNSTSINLAGTAASNANYQWTTNDGLIVGGANTLTPEISLPGTYTLTVIVPSTGCEASSSIVVTEDVDAPQISVVEPEILSCTNQEIIIDASQSTSNNVDILWTSVDNNPIQNENSLMPTIFSPGVYTLTLINQNTGCESTREVVLAENTSTPDLNLPAEVALDCEDPNTLIGENEFPDYTYSWSSANATISGSASDAQIQVDEQGIYELLVTDNTSGCEARYEINVTADFVATEILSLDAEEINCSNQISVPNLEIDSDISEVNITWTTSNGLIISGANTTTPEIAESGIYNIEIVNIESGCITTESIEVSENFNEPMFELGATQTLTCIQNSITTGLALNEQESTYTYVWSDMAGNIISNEPQIEISSSQTVFLEVINTENGCSFIDGLTVEEDIDLPVVEVVVGQTFRCGDTEIALSGSLSSSISNYEINWETDNGNISSGQNSFNPTVSQPGTYTMTVTNLDNQCEASAMVTVEPDVDAPSAVIDPVGDLTCDVTSLLLDGTSSNGQGTLTYTWFRDGQQINSGDQQITIDQPGDYDLIVLDTDNNCSTTTSAFIELNNTDPVFTIIDPSQLDCDNREVELGIMSEQNNDLVYTWTSVSGTGIVSGGDSANPTINEPGDYTLEVINQLTGCSYSQSVAVLQDASVPEFELSSTGDLDCENSRVDILANITPGDFTLVWTNLTTGIVLTSSAEEIEVTQPGTYQLELIDNTTQCASARIIDVSENVEVPQLDALQPLAISCDNTSTTIAAEIVNNLSNVNIIWTTVNGEIASQNLNSLEIDVLAGGTYTMEVTNLESGCTNSIDIIVDENGEAPNFEFEEVNQLDCNNNEVELSITSMNSGVSQNILWTTASGNILGNTDEETILVDQPGIYTVTVVNQSNGCSSESSIEVEQDLDKPLLNSSGAEELNCTVLETELSVSIGFAPDYETTWSTNDGNIIGAINSESTIVNQPGDYTITVVNLENGCVSELVIPVSQNIEVPTVDIADADIITCKTEVVALTGTIPSGLNASLIWSNNNGGITSDPSEAMIEVNMPGTYTLTVTDLDNNCVGTDEILVEENTDVPTGFTPVVSEPLCFGDLGSVNIVEVDGGVGPYTYSINGSTFDSVSDFDQLAPGVYNVEIMDSEECTYLEEVVIPETPEIVLSSTPEIEVLVGQDNQLNINANIPDSEIATITWSPVEYLSCDNCLNPIVTPLNDITYTVTIEDENGCSATENIVFRVDRIAGIYTPNAFSPNGDGINDAFTLYSKEDIIDKISELAIYDRWGNQVYINNDFPVNEEQFGWDGSYRGIQLQPDVFVFKAVVLLANGKNEEITGNISLMR